MNSPSKDMRQKLIDEGVSSSILFIGQEPDSPDTVITIYDTLGMMPANPRWLIDEPTFQIRSRSVSYETAYSQLLNARDILLGLPKTTISSTKYIGVWTTTDIASLQRDEEDRVILIVNFRMVRELSSGINRQPTP